MEFLVSRAELLLVCHISNSLSYDLHQNGSLTKPKKWCGSGTRFCLRTATTELAKMNNFELPTEATILSYWNSIVIIRNRKVELKLAKKANASS